ncbi:MAG: hypothetical protein C4526_02215 [Nitrospiraceae bacterium]|nr:MAG: hypothetical protein C4526_02215 [Nitrospiraceae bacterium]
MFIRDTNKIFSCLIALIFFAIICAPLLMFGLSGHEEISVAENRKLASLPRFQVSPEGLKELPNQVEKYYQDHFGFRLSFLHLYQLIKYKIGDSPTEHMIIGKEGWLFGKGKGYFDKNDQIDNYRNINVLSSEELDHLTKTLVAKHLWLKEKGIKFIFIIAPSKHTIYSEYIPSYFTKVQDKSALDQVVEALQQYPDFTIVDLRRGLIDHKKNSEHFLYYRLDSHWNSYGANIAQYEIAKSIESYFPGRIKPILNKPEGFDAAPDRSVAGSPYLIKIKEEDPLPIWKSRCGIERIHEKNEQDGIFTTSCKDADLKAVVFRDSFFIALQPFISEYFRRITYISDEISYTELEKYVTSEKPDIVLEEWVERKLLLSHELDDRFLMTMNKLD